MQNYNTMHKHTILQDIVHKLLYILEQQSSWSTSGICPSWPHSRHKLSPMLASLYEHASCCHAQPSILLFIVTGQVSHLAPSESGWLLTNVQVNITTTLYDTWHTCTYIHHISITIHFFFLHIFHSSWLAGCPRPIMLAAIRPHFS